MTGDPEPVRWPANRYKKQAKSKGKGRLISPIRVREVPKRKTRFVSLGLGTDKSTILQIRISQIFMHILLLVIILLPAGIHAQYNGGNGSGMAVTVTVQLPAAITDSLYTGGIADGITLSSVNSRNLSMADSVYNGGIADGFSDAAANARSISLVDSLYSGGAGQGISSGFSATRPIGIADSLYSGGAGDGFNAYTINLRTIGLSDSVYAGGFGDGITETISLLSTIGLTDSLYNGGSGQGHSSVVTIFRTLGITDSLYNGGYGKGDWLFLAPTVNLGTCTGDTLIWNGSVNILWGNPDNWDCGVVPGINSTVIIPSGRERYPTLLSNAEIRSLRLQPGTSVNLLNGAELKLNGQ